MTEQAEPEVRFFGVEPPPLLLELSDAVRESERRFRTRAVIRVNGETTAEAEGTFVLARETLGLPIVAASSGRHPADA